jgi:hypothetical protein
MIAGAKLKGRQPRFEVTSLDLSPMNLFWLQDAGQSATTL